MEDVKMMLFARWLSTCYADEHLDDKMRYTDNPDFDRTTAMSGLCPCIRFTIFTSCQ